MIYVARGLILYAPCLFALHALCGYVFPFFFLFYLFRLGVLAIRGFCGIVVH